MVSNSVTRFLQPVLFKLLYGDLKKENDASDSEVHKLVIQRKTKKNFLIKILYNIIKLKNILKNCIVQKETQKTPKEIKANQSNTIKKLEYKCKILLFQILEMDSKASTAILYFNLILSYNIYRFMQMTQMRI